MSTISCYKKSLAHLLYRRYAKTSAFLVRPTGLEPAALRVGVLRSIRMSYERNYLLIISHNSEKINRHQYAEFLRCATNCGIIYFLDKCGKIMYTTIIKHTLLWEAAHHERRYKGRQHMQIFGVMFGR